MRSRATAERAAPRLGIIASIALHVGLVVALFVSFSKKLDLPMQETPMVPVDLVTVADKTNIAPQVKPDNTPPPDVPMTQPTPPEVAPPKIDVAPEEAKPTPKKAEEKKFNINDIEKILSQKKFAQAKTGQRNITGVGAQNALTADLQTMLASQIYRCWSPPVGAVNAQDLVVAYDIYLDRGGNVADKPKLLSEDAPAGTPRRAANEAANRAIFACAPYKLPANRYAEWRHFSFRFNPRDLVGQ